MSTSTWPKKGDLLYTEEEVNKLKAENERLRELIKLMQSAVQDYLPPVPQYADKDWLINRLIYLLDGPEQRAAIEPVVLDEISRKAAKGLTGEAIRKKVNSAMEGK